MDWISSQNENFLVDFRNCQIESKICQLFFSVIFLLKLNICVVCVPYKLQLANGKIKENESKIHVLFNENSSITSQSEWKESTVVKTKISFIICMKTWSS
jgi:hypothetical protein